jgi:LPS export ABC transporter protein LptC
VVLQTKSTIIFLLLCFIGIIACSNENVISTVSLKDTDVLPSIHGENITSLISDSGITRYCLKAEIWDMYSGIPEPYWYFPKGIYFEILDSLFNKEGYIEADTARFDEKKDLWELTGNVRAQNLQGDKFETSKLFWNKKEPANSIHSVYTDSVVRIDMGDKIITSQGLRSTQSMSEYRFYHNSIEMIVDEDKLNQPADSIQTLETKHDSIP